MTSVLDGSPEKPAERLSAPSGMACPECGVVFPLGHPNKMFCNDKHRKDFLNRLTARGSVLTPLVMAARITRGGTCRDTITGIRARREAEQLIQRWVVEDREAGRMAADKYMALRYRKGFPST